MQHACNANRCDTPLHNGYHRGILIQVDTCTHTAIKLIAQNTRLQVTRNSTYKEVHAKNTRVYNEIQGTGSQSRCKN